MKTRYQFEVSKALAAEVEWLEDEADFGSHQEFFRNLVTLWRWAAHHTRQGKVICALSEDSASELDAQRLSYNQLTLGGLEFIRMKIKAERPLTANGIGPETEALKLAAK